MDNPVTLATLSTQDTRRIQTKHKNTTHKTKKKDQQHGPDQKLGV